MSPLQINYQMYPSPLKIKWPFGSKNHVQIIALKIDIQMMVQLHHLCVSLEWLAVDIKLQLPIYEGKSHLIFQFFMQSISKGHFF